MTSFTLKPEKKLKRVNYGRKNLRRLRVMERVRIVQATKRLLR
jgi:hypothetical protein